MPIELVIFDCDGVLVDSEPLTTALIVEHVQRLGLELDVESALRRFKGGRMADVIAYVEKQLGITVPEDFVPQFRAELAERLGSQVEAVPGIVQVVAELQWPSCVASNGPRMKMDASLGRAGLLAYFEGRIYSAYEVGSFKPEPDLFLHAAAAHGASPVGCVVIEDSVSGVRAGVAAGMTVLAYDAEGDGDAMAQAGGRLFEDMRLLPELLLQLDA